MENRRWQDWVMLVLGVWLFFAPFFMSYGPLTNAAAWNSYIVGGAVSVFAVWALSSPEKWEEWVNLALGAWLVIAPFALDFYGTQETAAWNQIVAGVLIGGDAIWALAQRPTHGTHAQHKNSA